MYKYDNFKLTYVTLGVHIATGMDKCGFQSQVVSLFLGVKLEQKEFCYERFNQFVFRLSFQQRRLLKFLQHDQSEIKFSSRRLFKAASILLENIAKFTKRFCIANIKSFL